MLRAGFAKSEVLSCKAFLHLWLEEFPWLKTRKAKTVDSKCTTCEDLQVTYAGSAILDPTKDNDKPQGEGGWGMLCMDTVHEERMVMAE